MRTRTFLVMTATSVALGATAGCNSPAAVRTGTGPIATPTATVTPPTRTASAPSPAGPQPCSARDLTVSQLPGDSAAGPQDAVKFAVIDTGPAACTLHGYPTFTLTVHSASMQTDVNVTPSLEHRPSYAAPFGGSPATVSLNPGDRAGFALLFPIVAPPGDANCDRPTELHLKAPGGGTTVGTVSLIQACGDAMTVSPYLPGSKLGL